MEETASENSSLDVPPDAENIVDDQQEVSYVTGQGWQYKNINPNPNVRKNPHLFNYPKPDNPVDNAQNSHRQNNGYHKGYQERTYILSQAQHNQFQNQKQQTAQQAAPAPMAAPTDEMKGLATMMQQLLQGQQIQGKALNQSAETYPTPATTSVEPVPLREYTPKVPYPVPAKKSRKDREEMKFL
ncbi:hypothetical protein F2Q69_00014826 [Brassica cretica]|uniref:Uncharacterized protein n=1 Tax=Brassica cretica TaxID=69181 RepID=A0A8S9QP32_BRACR|nr:hypothetical protein F2Q69_00014826 [Brassica cretica]